MQAAQAALDDAGARTDQVEALFLGTFSPGTFIHQEHVAPLIASELGLANVPSTRLENACASGSTAFASGMMAIAAGVYDVVLIVGAEKMTSTPIGEATSILAEAARLGDREQTGAYLPGRLRADGPCLHGEVW